MARVLRRGAGVALLLSICLHAPSAVAQDSSGSATLVGVRILYDQDSCPRLAEVYLEHATDTISGFELRLGWDRPDFALFSRAESAPTPVLGADSTKPGKSSSQPVVERDSTALRDWEYVEARSQAGLWVKVTALATLTKSAPERLIYPGQSCVLLRLPLSAGRPAENFLAGDSAILLIEPYQTRLSRSNGQLVDSVDFRNAATRISACRRAADPRQ